jgi:hypothetical protein
LLIVEKRTQNTAVYWKANTVTAEQLKLRICMKKKRRKQKIQETASFKGQGYRTFGTIQ